MRLRPVALAAALVALAACVKQYRPPAPGEPAALVKLKLAYDHRRAREVHAGTLAVHVAGTEGEDRYALATRSWPEVLRSDEPSPLEIVPITVHAGRPLTLAVRLAVHWQTTEMKTVQETERVPRTVTRTETVYNSSTRSSQTRTYTVTEYDTRSKTVTKPVTTNHEAGCTAQVALRPEAGAVYLVDYTNLALTQDCTASGFRQVPGPDGTFALTPL